MAKVLTNLARANCLVIDLVIAAVCCLQGIACDSTGSINTDSNTDTGETIPEVDTEQEESMCADLDATTGSFVMAGESINEGHSLNGAGGLDEISLVGTGDQMGGYVEVKIDDDTPLVLLVKEEVQVEILDTNGDPVENVEYSSNSELCPEANGRFVWIVKNGYNHLHFGPTSISSIHAALEIVE